MPDQELVESGVPLVTEPEAQIVFNAKMLTELLHRASVQQDLAGRDGYIERCTLVARYDTSNNEWKGRLFCI